jgi:hypothetical protein
MAKGVRVDIPEVLLLETALERFAGHRWKAPENRMEVPSGQWPGFVDAPDWGTPDSEDGSTR